LDISGLMFHNRGVKTVKLSIMGGSGKTVTAAMADFIARGQRAQEAVDRIIEAERARHSDPRKSRPKP
jgi:hypothetical protein